MTPILVVLTALVLGAVISLVLAPLVIFLLRLLDRLLRKSPSTMVYGPDSGTTIWNIAVVTSGRLSVASDGPIETAHLVEVWSIPVQTMPAMVVCQNG